MFCASAIKTSPVSPLGIRLWSPPTQNAPLLLVHIDDHGLFAGKFKTGLQITQINDMECQGMTVVEVEASLSQLVGRVTVWATAPPLFSSCSVNATTPILTVKTTPSSKCRGGPDHSVPNLADLSEATSSTRRYRAIFKITTKSCLLCFERVFPIDFYYGVFQNG